jgi:hypothetical protein
MRHDDLGDARAHRTKQLLFHAADRKHAAGERELSGHRHIAPHMKTAQGRNESRRHGDAGRRTVFGNRSRGHVNVHFVLAQGVFSNAQ